MDPTSLSRRQVLAGLGGIGTAGAISGAGTFALLESETSGSGSISAGTVSVDVNGRETLTFDVRGIDRGDSGRERLGISNETNPAWLWLGSDCPPSRDPLGDALRVRLRWDERTIATGTLSEVRRVLRSGRLLGGSCTAPGETGLEISWELPEDAPDSAADRRTGIEFELRAEQCRHNDAGGTVNPFAGRTPCDEPVTCVSCPRSDGSDGDRIAEATFQYDGPDGALVELIRQGPGAGGGDVLTGVSADAGTEFTATLHAPPSVTGGPDIDVVVDGTTIGDFHISCSEPFGPGLVVGDGTYSLTVLSAVDTEGNQLCEA